MEESFNTFTGTDKIPSETVNALFGYDNDGKLLRLHPVAYEDESNFNRAVWANVSNDDTSNPKPERTSLTKRISALINRNAVINYEGSKYEIAGYELLKVNGRKHISIGLKDMKADAIYWFGLDRVRSVLEEVELD